MLSYKFAARQLCALSACCLQLHQGGRWRNQRLISCPFIFFAWNLPFYHSLRSNNHHCAVVPFAISCTGSCPPCSITAIFPPWDTNLFPSEIFECGSNGRICSFFDHFKMHQNCALMPFAINCCTKSCPASQSQLQMLIWTHTFSKKINLSI